MNKDAEVHTLCLLSYWMKDADFNASCADLCFEFSAHGVGTKQSTSTLKLIDSDEKQRTVQGVSGWRRCVLYADLAAQMAVEGRCSDKGSEGERLLQMLRDDAVQIGSINAETLGRYVSLGRRCKDRIIITTLQCWEALCKRDMLVDSVTTLRHVFSSTEHNDSLAMILRTLMMEQRAGLRTKMDTPRSRNEPKHPTNIAKGIVLRKQLLDFILASFSRAR